MWRDVELRELRVFLVLANELYVADPAESRTPERGVLRLATSSQPYDQPNTDSASGVGRASAAALRRRRRSGPGDPCPPHGWSWSSGLPAGYSFSWPRTNSVRVDTTRGRAGVPARLGPARTSLVSGGAAPASGSTWSGPPRRAGDERNRACCRHGRNRQAQACGPWCISSARGSSVQVGGQDRWRFCAWHKRG